MLLAEPPRDLGTSVEEPARKGIPTTRRRGIRWAVLAVGLAVLAGVGVAWDTRPVGTARLLGVDYRAVVRTGQCHATWRGRSCTSIPAALMAALVRARGRPAPVLRAALDTAAADQASFDVDGWTHALRWATHLRTLDDSLRWRTAVDSTWRVLDERARAGDLIPLPCDTAALHVLTAEAWRAGDHEIRLYAAWVGRRQAHPRPPHGYVVLDWMAFGTPGCGRDVPERHYRLLSADEIARRAIEWLTGGRDE